MRRLLLIARREYLAYTRTVGFWISLIVLPMIIALSALSGTMLARSTSQHSLAVVDLTGRNEKPAVMAALDRIEQRSAAENAAIAKAVGAPRSRQVPRGPVTVVEPPPDLAHARDEAEADRLAKRYVAGGPQAPPKLDAVAVLVLRDGALSARLWSASASNPAAAAELREALADAGRDERLRASGIDPDKVAKAEAFEPQIDTLSPRSASGGRVELRDQLPLWIGLGSGFLLWSLTMTAAGILMNSVMEEKSNRVLEILLSSASTSEILAGKVIGVAGIALTVLAVWAGAGLTSLHRFAPDMIGPLLDALARDGLWAYLAAYFLGGYLMFAVLFAAVGAFCETPRDAQALMGPIMIVMMVPLIVLQFALRSPDMPVLRALSWVPFFTPFLMAARGPTHLSVFEVAGTLAAMAATAGVMIWIGGKAFRAGALATGRFDLRGVIAAVRGRS